jgi:hypothetical protein
METFKWRDIWYLPNPAFGLNKNHKTVVYLPLKLGSIARPKFLRSELETQGVKMET